MLLKTIEIFLEKCQFVQDRAFAEHWNHAVSNVSILVLSESMMHQHTKESWELWINQFPDSMLVWEAAYDLNSAVYQRMICAKIHPSKSVFARDTRIVAISADLAREFLDANHILGFSKGQTYLACIVPPHRHFRGITSGFQWDGNPLLAVAVFGKPMRMKEAGLEGVLSGELIKVASLPEIRLVGGISKFLQAYHQSEPVHHVMTYIDLGWNSGKGFLSAGFAMVSKKDSLYFQIDEDKRHVVQHIEEANYFSPGNLKLRYTYAR